MKTITNNKTIITAIYPELTRRGIRVAVDMAWTITGDRLPRQVVSTRQATAILTTARENQTQYRTAGQIRRAALWDWIEGTVPDQVYTWIRQHAPADWL